MHPVLDQLSILACGYPEDKIVFVEDLTAKSSIWGGTSQRIRRVERLSFSSFTIILRVGILLAVQLPLIVIKGKAGSICCWRVDANIALLTGLFATW